MALSSNCREAKDVTLYDNSKDINGTVAVMRVISH